MENRSLPIGFIIKQVNNVYEKDLNERTRGMTKRETEALRKNLDKILNNIADP